MVNLGLHGAEIPLMAQGGGKRSAKFKTYKKEEEEAAYQSGATIHLYCSS